MTNFAAQKKESIMRKNTTTITRMSSTLRQGLLVAVASIFSCCVGNAQGGAYKGEEKALRNVTITLTGNGVPYQLDPSTTAVCSTTWHPRYSVPTSLSPTSR